MFENLRKLRRKKSASHPTLATSARVLQVLLGHVGKRLPFISVFWRKKVVTKSRRAWCESHFLINFLTLIIVGVPPPELRAHTYLELEGDAVGLAQYRPAILTTQAMLQSVAPRHGLSPTQAPAPKPRKCGAQCTHQDRGPMCNCMGSHAPSPVAAPTPSMMHVNTGTRPSEGHPE